MPCPNSKNCCSASSVTYLHSRFELPRSIHFAETTSNRQRKPLLHGNGFLKLLPNTMLLPSEYAICIVLEDQEVHRTAFRRQFLLERTFFYRRTCSLFRLVQGLSVSTSSLTHLYLHKRASRNLPNDQHQGPPPPRKLHYQKPTLIQTLSWHMPYNRYWSKRLCSKPSFRKRNPTGNLKTHRL